MLLNGGEFISQTNKNNGTFEITIEQEGDWSTDGGHSFENVENVYGLSKEEAKDLRDELNQFLNT